MPPVGLELALDDLVVELGESLIYGGSPALVLRLDDEHRSVWQQLRTTRATTPENAGLVRRLLDLGVVHPRPRQLGPATQATRTGNPGKSRETGRTEIELEVVVPVRGRVGCLDICLETLGLGARVVVVDDGSRNPAELAAVADRHGARLVRRPASGGPAAARNDGFAATTAPVVAFVDSDVRVSADTLAALAGHLADPAVGAVAPRMRATPREGWFGTYVAGGGLDRGAVPARVAPDASVTFVPTATLVCRRTAITGVSREHEPFETRLRYGEDVDLVWRLGQGGWTVRYEPGHTAHHEGPMGWRPHLLRRFAYGTAAGPLGRRHPRQVAVVRARPWPMLVVISLLARRPGLAAGSMLGYLSTMWLFLLRRRVPRRGLLLAGFRAVNDVAYGVGRAGAQLALPVVAAAALRRPRHAGPLAVLLLGGVLRDWWPHRRALGAPRFVAARLAEDVAYGAGVWVGCARARTLAPLVPRIGGRSIRVERSTPRPASTSRTSMARRRRVPWPIS